jgi:hypothetical protein
MLAAATSATGATTKDLIRRMGQDSERAALIYQHATNEAAIQSLPATDDPARTPHPFTRTGVLVRANGRR